MGRVLAASRQGGRVEAGSTRTVGGMRQAGRGPRDDSSSEDGGTRSPRCDRQLVEGVPTLPWRLEGRSGRDEAGRTRPSGRRLSVPSSDGGTKSAKRGRRDEVGGTRTAGRRRRDMGGEMKTARQGRRDKISGARTTSQGRQEEGHRMTYPRRPAGRLV